MVYDALAESVRLIDGGSTAGQVSLTRRRRFLPVAVDVDEDVAAAVFLRRAHGGSEWEEHVLSRTVDGWQLLGGGGWGLDRLDALTSIPTVDEIGGYAEIEETGSSEVAPSKRPRSGARWVYYSTMRTTADVSRVVVAGNRTLSRPRHGRVVVVWRDTPNVQLTLLGSAGQVLQRLDVLS